MKLAQILLFQLFILHTVSGQIGFFSQNTICRLGPNALGFSIPQTCFDSATGRRRCFYTYTPECAGEGSPLVYDIHGYTSCPYWHSSYTGWKSLADEKCMVIVWPTGNVCRETASAPCWAVPYGMSGLEPNPEEDTPPCCCFKGNELVEPSETEDLAFLRSIASYVVRDMPERTDGRVSIDIKKIYMAGHSNGCMISYAMAMEHSDFVAAVCCHAGTLLTPPADDYDPVPIWAVHGTEDSVLPYEGVSIDEMDSIWALPSAQAGFDALHILNDCTNKSTTIIDEGNIQTGSGCANNATVELLSLTGVDHTPYAGSDTDYKTTEAAWNFCSSFESFAEPELYPI